MTRVATVVGVAASVLCAANVTAQTRPDFSGRWTSEPERATPAPRGGGRGGGAARAGDMGSGWGPTITVAHDAKRLSVEYLFFARGDMQPPLKFVYALDGSESKNSVMMGRGIQVQTSKTTWDGDKLIITTVHTFENPADSQPMKIEVKQTLALESPTALIVETTRSSVLGGPPSTTRTAYRKN